jgi:xanthine dehydrogenase small subunit
MKIRPIHFVHRGRIVSVDSSAPDRTVLEWLREDAHCTGTKEGCAEGDCGACTVIVAEPDPESNPARADGLRLQAINSCIRFLPTLDGKALITVEDLACGQDLHPVQQAMVNCHAAQCGFCTPGIVMSLTAGYERHCEAGTLPSRRQVADDLAGNLCRCTGYRPILDAALKSFDLPRTRLDTAGTVALLKDLSGAPALCYETLHPAAGSTKGRFFAPRTLDDLAQLYEQMPKASLLAGSTDMGLWVTKQLRELGDVLYLGDVAALQRIELQERGLLIGAGASLEAAWSALVVQWPELREIWLRFAGPTIRYAGTMGGNVANGSPIGDSAPVLMALNAQLVLRKGPLERTLPLDEFYLGYRRNQLQPGEFLQAIFVPERAKNTMLRVWKISKRYDCDISAVCAAFSIRLEQETVSEVRFAFGGMAPTVKRAHHAERAALGQGWSQATAQAVANGLALDFDPISDLRATHDYRLQAARSLVQRLWLQTRPDAPLSDADSTVWGVAATLPPSVALDGSAPGTTVTTETAGTAGTTGATAAPQASNAGMKWQ